jgi:hypothetical protein
MEQTRECGECDLCCKWLSHDVYGQLVSPNNPCRFIKNGCSIHPNRPAQCKRYFCMWAQGVLPEWMYPKDIGVMVSVKNWPQGQWLEVVECGVEMIDEVMMELLKFEVPIVLSNKVIGSPEFTEFYKNYVKTYSNFLPSVSD